MSNFLKKRYSECKAVFSNYFEDCYEWEKLYLIVAISLAHPTKLGSIYDNSGTTSFSAVFAINFGLHQIHEAFIGLAFIFALIFWLGWATLISFKIRTN